jgi:hypothetical protein
MSDAVTGDHDRLAADGPGLDTLAQELRAAFPRWLRLMVEMDVEHVEAASAAIDQPRPGADAGDVVAPRLRGWHSRGI